MRPAQLAFILDREFESTTAGHHTPVMLWGPPGVGKSQIVAQVAARHGVPIIDIRLSQMEPSDLRGIPFRVENRVEWAVPAMLPDANRHWPAGILFLDEITSAPPAVSAAAYQLILDRKLGRNGGRRGRGPEFQKSQGGRKAYIPVLVAEGAQQHMDRGHVAKFSYQLD